MIYSEAELKMSWLIVITEEETMEKCNVLIYYLQELSYIYTINIEPISNNLVYYVYMTIFLSS